MLIYVNKVINCKYLNFDALFHKGLVNLIQFQCSVAADLWRYVSPPTSKGVFHPGQGGCFQGEELVRETLVDQALITFCSSVMVVGRI